MFPFSLQQLLIVLLRDGLKDLSLDLTVKIVLYVYMLYIIYIDYRFAGIKVTCSKNQVQKIIIVIHQYNNNVNLIMLIIFCSKFSTIINNSLRYYRRHLFLLK